VAQRLWSILLVMVPHVTDQTVILPTEAASCIARFWQTDKSVIIMMVLHKLRETTHDREAATFLIW